MVSAEPHDLAGMAIHYMEEVTTGRSHDHLKGDYRFWPTNQVVELCGGEQGALV